MKKLFLLAFAASSVLATAQFGPNNLGPESASTSGVNTAIRNAPRTYQAYYASSAFTGYTGSKVLTGMQLRLAIGENWRPAGYSGSTWPNVAATFTNYSVTLARASSQLVTDGEYLSLTPTFASYLVSPVVVRTGALNVTANSFNASGGTTGEHTFGFTIPFTTTYTWNPGETLVVQINHEGYAGGALNAFFATRPFQNGLCDAISSTASGTAVAPSGFSSPYYLNFTTQAVPEPATLAVLGAGALALVRRRRTR